MFHFSSFSLRPTTAAVRAALGLVSGFGLMVGASVAQTESPTAEVQQVVVTATRTPVPVRQLAADVTVITRAQLSDSVGESLVDAISRLSGVQISRTGGPGQTSGTFMRGVAQKQAIVLIDGVRMVDNTAGGVALETLPLDLIERVEVLKGPASSLWGADAVGGVIHIITRQAKEPLQAQIKVGVGTYGSTDVSAGLGGRSFDDRLKWQVGVSKETSRGVSVENANGPDYNPDADGFQLTASHVNLSFALTPSDQLQVKVLSSDINSRYDGTEDSVYDSDWALISSNSAKDFRTQKTTQVTSLGWTSRWRDDLSSEVRLSNSEMKSLTGISETSDIRSHRQQVSAQLNWDASEDIRASGVAEHVSDSGRLEGYYGNYDQDRGLTALGIAVQGGRTGDVSWQADARYERSSVYGGATTGRAGLRWAINSEVSAQAVLGTSFRAPTFDDLYYPGYSNLSLKPEHGFSQELALNWLPSETTGHSVRVWRNSVQDLIEVRQVQNKSKPVNIGEALLEGLSWKTHTDLGGLKMSVQTDWTQALNVQTRQRLVRRAIQQHTVSVARTVSTVTYTADVKFLGSRSDFGSELPSETTLNLGANWRVDREWTLQTRLLNATNTAIQPAFGYQGLGRQLWVNAVYRPAFQ